jgi:hypothetical protein
MKTDAQSLVLLLGGGGFVSYLFVKALTALGQRDDGFMAARKRMLEAKARAGDRALPAAERAGAWREAANIALDDLQRPGLAASLARRAERADPEHPGAVGLLALSLRRGARYSALERLLWRQLADEQDAAAPRYVRALDELIALYDGPLGRPDTARVLRRYQSTSASSAPSA